MAGVRDFSNDAFVDELVSILFQAVNVAVNEWKSKSNGERFSTIVNRLDMGLGSLELVNRERLTEHLCFPMLDHLDLFWKEGNLSSGYMNRIREFFDLKKEDMNITDRGSNEVVVDELVRIYSTSIDSYTQDQEWKLL